MQNVVLGQEIVNSPHETPAASVAHWLAGLFACHFRPFHTSPNASPPPAVPCPPTATHSRVPGQATASMNVALVPRGITRDSAQTRPFQCAAEDPEIATHIVADAHETLRGTSPGAATARHLPWRNSTANPSRCPEADRRTPAARQNLRFGQDTLTSRSGPALARAADPAPPGEPGLARP
jgi:hypothetical protein